MKYFTAFYVSLALLLLLVVSCHAQDISINSIDIIPESLKDHHVSMYRVSNLLITRRGTPLRFRVTASRPLSTYTFEFAIPDYSIHLKANVISTTGMESIVEVTSSSQTPIGKYSMVAYLLNGNDSRVVSQKPYTTPLVILFNPYNPSDTVYLSDTSLLSEYIENENGVAWLGSVENHSPKYWYYGQFDQNAITSALHLLEAPMNRESRNQESVDLSLPTSVSRYLTFAVNAQSGNPDGILIGRWASDFPGGTPPTSWTGSHQILQQYVQSGFRPVSFAQCWVFSGILNTMLRTLGIPARQITVFESAHEKPDHGKFKDEIEMYYDQNSTQLVSETGTVWNFHSWNDAWMSRTDLNKGLGGWQAVDATPQELSSGVFQLGPAPTQAVRTLNVDQVSSTPYDVPFVKSETQSVIQNYLVNCIKSFTDTAPECTIVKPLAKDTSTVGSLIVTKGIQTEVLSDITSEYKPTATLAAAFMVTAPTSTDFVAIRVESASGSPMLGKPLSLTIRILPRNPSDEKSQVDIKVDVTDYRGVVIRTIKRETHEIKLSSASDVQLVVNPSEYITAGTPDPHIRVTIVAKKLDLSPTEIEHGEGIVIHRFQTFLRIPDATLTIREVSRLRSGELARRNNNARRRQSDESWIEIQFTNPLGQVVSDLQMSLSVVPDGQEEVIPLGTVAPGATILIKRPLNKRPQETKTVIANVFSSVLTAHQYAHL